MKHISSSFVVSRRAKILSLLVFVLLTAIVVLPILLVRQGLGPMPQKPVKLVQQKHVQATPEKGMALQLAPQPTPGITAIATPTLPTSTPSPIAVVPTVTPIVATNHFVTLPPGSLLPDEATCAARVRRSAWEPRTSNYTANHTVPTAQQIAGLNPQQNPYTSVITGNFTGTTDEILQWVACKWGVDENIVKAEAIVESYWVQSTNGAPTTNQALCPPNTWDGKQCHQYYGLLQLTYTYWNSAWPMMRDDTAFSAEYIYGIVRNCYEGRASFVATTLPGYPAYHAGDIWGCIGSWYSGQWYSQNSLDYITSVKQNFANKIWLKPGF